jgi:hypothetical protein
MIRKRNKLFSVVALSALVATAASCGSDKKDAATTTAAPTTAAATTAAPTTAAATTAAPTTEAAATTEAADTTEAPATTEGGSDTTEGGADTTEGGSDTTEGGGEVKQTVNIGVAWADLSAFVSVNPAYGTGDPEQQALAVLDGWHRDGLLPVNGVDINFVTEGYSAIDGDAKLGVCEKFGTEGDIFAVISGRDFSAGAECLATKYKMPVIDTNQAAPSLMEETAPYMFTLKPTDVEIATELANWGVSSGALTGKKVGLFWETEAKDAADAIKGILDSNSITLASEVESGGQGSVGSDQDALAAQKFQSDGVDEVIFLVGSSSMVNFLQAANDQGYKPGYIDGDWASHMSDVAAGAYNKDQWSGVKALSNSTNGDLKKGLGDAAKSCLENYNQFAGADVDDTAPEKSGEITNIFITCDLASVLLEGIKNATADGAELTQDSFIKGVEAIQDLKGAMYDTISYSADDHTGASTARQVAWDSDCPCWVPDGDWKPIADYEK